MSRLKEFTKKEWAYFLWACTLSVVGCFLLVASMYIPPRGSIDASIISAAGLVFVFSGSIIGIRGSFDGKLIRFEREIEAKIQRRKEDETEQNEKEDA